MQRDCHADTCPVGICTQNECLRSRFMGKPEHVVNYMLFVAESLREIMAQLGFRTVDEMIGHPECLRQVEIPNHPKANSCDLSAILARAKTLFSPGIPGASARRYLPEMAFDEGLDETLDATLLIPYTADARSHMRPIRLRADISNVNRCVGTMLGSRITKAHPEGLPEGSITIDCTGSAGQSFGAFLPAGITLNVSGDANDYFGKGLSGGILSVAPPSGASFKFDENVCVGNVAFYGATAGRGFVNGLAGQRFGVRNSGATIVCEGVGNHGCEYMTGGVALILGEVGQNFAAGMSGGVAYVYDRFRTLASRCNTELVELLTPDEDDFELIHALLEEHVERTQSPRGIKLLFQFSAIRRRFVKVIPREYRLIVEQAKKEQEAGFAPEEAMERAFEALRGEM